MQGRGSNFWRGLGSGSLLFAGLALLFAVFGHHQHDDAHASASPSGHACLICKMTDHLVQGHTPPAEVVLPLREKFFARAVSRPAFVSFRSSFNGPPRAPPAAS